VPEEPTNGSIWFDSTSAKLYVYVEDDDSNQWVQPVYPTVNTLTDLGITDGTVGQVLTTDGAGIFTFEDAAGGGTGNFTLAASNITTDDSSIITITPAVTMNSDLTVENDLTVSNYAYAKSFVTNGTGLPKLDSASTLTITAPDGIILQNSPLRMASFTTTTRNALAPQNGDIIYNTTDNKFQGYENGSWVNLV
jgi:hypothetical protein